VFDEKAGVLDDEKARSMGFGGRLGASDSLLKPQGFCMNGNSGIGDARNLFDAAKDVHDIDGNGNILQTGVGSLAEDFGFVGINGNDGVAGGLKVSRDLVRGASGIGRQTNDRDGRGMA